MARQRTVLNLTVHGIGPAGHPLDPGEERTWVSVEQFEAAVDALVDRRDVHITFDDGNRSDVEIALPRLIERGLRADFFLLAGRLGEAGRVDRADVRELVSAGMGIGSHGWAHRDWRRIDDAQAREEIDDAPGELSRIAGRPVRHVAIPFGSYDRQVLGRLRRAGMERVYTSDGGRARAGAWLQNRASLTHDLDRDWITRVIHREPSVRPRVRRVAATLVKRTRGRPAASGGTGG